MQPSSEMTKKEREQLEMAKVLLPAIPIGLVEQVMTDATFEGGRAAVVKWNHLRTCRWMPLGSLAVLTETLPETIEMSIRHEETYCHWEPEKWAYQGKSAIVTAGVLHLVQHLEYFHHLIGL